MVSRGVAASVGCQRQYRAGMSKKHSKLLNVRDFRACQGFPLAAKTRYNSLVANRRELWPGQFPPAWLFMPKRAIGPAEFRAYMLLTHP